MVLFSNGNRWNDGSKGIGTPLFGPWEAVCRTKLQHYHLHCTPWLTPIWCTEGRSELSWIRVMMPPLEWSDHSEVRTRMQVCSVDSLALPSWSESHSARAKTYRDGWFWSSPCLLAPPRFRRAPRLRISPLSRAAPEPPAVAALALLVLPQQHCA